MYYFYIADTLTIHSCTACQYSCRRVLYNNGQRSAQSGIRARFTVRFGSQTNTRQSHDRQLVYLETSIHPIETLRSITRSRAGGLSGATAPIGNQSRIVVCSPHFSSSHISFSTRPSSQGHKPNKNQASQRSTPHEVRTMLWQCTQQCSAPSAPGMAQTIRHRISPRFTRCPLRCCAPRRGRAS